MTTEPDRSRTAEIDAMNFILMCWCTSCFFQKEQIGNEWTSQRVVPLNLPAIRGKELKKYVLTVAKKKQRQWIVS